MTQTHDIVVVGGTPGGIAAAVRTARAGHDTLLVTYNHHLGGMMAGGLSYTDTLTMKARCPILEEFVDRVRTHYADTYGEDSTQYEYCENGYIFEPHVAEGIFDDLTAEADALTIERGYHPVSVERTGRSINSVTFESFDNGSTLEVAGDIFVEATYEGDLMATAGVDYRVGREPREEYNEQFAGRLFTQARGDRYYPHEAVGNEDDSAPPDRRGPLHVPEDKQQGALDLIPHPAGLTEIYPGSTGAGDDAIQAYNYRLCLSNDPDNRRLPERPPDYDRTEHLEALEVIRESGLRPYLLLRYLPNNKADMNSADLAGHNHDYPEADWERRHELADRHRNYALGLLYFLQNDDEVPGDIQAEAREWGLAKDEFTDNENFPWQFYVREARRLDGRRMFTENDARHARGLDRAPVNEDAIAIAEYPLDSHACHEERMSGSKPEGFFYASQVTRPAQVPFRSLLPKGVDNLLVPVPLSATHVAYGTIRLEPTWIHIGEAAGYAASLAQDTATPPGRLATEEIQHALVESGVMISFFNEFDMATDAPWVPAVQYLGARGYFDSYDARPADALGANTAAAWVDRTADHLDPDPASGIEVARSLPEADGDAISAHDFDDLLADVGIDADTRDLDGTVTRGEAAQVLYDSLTV